MALEEQMKQLRELTQKLEQSSLPLEEAVQLYAQGMELAAARQKELEQAKLQISKQTVPLQKQEDSEDETGK